MVSLYVDVTNCSTPGISLIADARSAPWTLREAATSRVRCADQPALTSAPDQIALSVAEAVRLYGPKGHHRCDDTHACAICSMAHAARPRFGHLSAVTHLRPAKTVRSIRRRSMRPFPAKNILPLVAP